MNIALIGYGRMGREIHRLAGDQTISMIVDPNETSNSTENLIQSLSEANFDEIDVAIDFTHPSTILDNMKLYCDKKVNVVIGTTGWYEHLDEVQGWVEEAGIGLLWASNFSIGVHLFWKMVQRGGELMNHFDEYDAFGHEYHHNQKADSPSGTARSTAKILIDTLDRKTEIATEMLDRKIEPNELHFSSTRGGNIPGTHSVFFDSPADTIEIKHTARNRSGFASGSLLCAEWLKGKSGFFSIEDYLKSLNI
ncbi:MAG: 4-hydroxy-tetrahydrodipicolinate reductase [Candidatus Peregrinibacteria bacterium]|nr:4-hydroxy-tetrahydrodipicolinate reductase [Candidatus Peregrinibacteria bacterium]